MPFQFYEKLEAVVIHTVSLSGPMLERLNLFTDVIDQLSGNKVFLK